MPCQVSPNVQHDHRAGCVVHAVACHTPHEELDDSALRVLGHHHRARSQLLCPAADTGAQRVVIHVAADQFHLVGDLHMMKRKKTGVLIGPTEKGFGAPAIITGA